ncbi:hypothetical protein SERLA73DRAFT_148912 [Serpula lacrymans var. lacrymans S7.3]|uniref:Uncharacterized protein n=2 Tax=Serpula lacrymans var. lacrymans TaxID=341189 RepID=F8PGN2_SERL3|nr:hypothetical protein SERLA73DRAFT_148912 [Serpula lacrymans var. lacrymans S7.3]
MQSRGLMAGVHVPNKAEIEANKIEDGEQAVSNKEASESSESEEENSEESAESGTRQMDDTGKIIAVEDQYVEDDELVVNYSHNSKDEVGPWLSDEDSVVEEEGGSTSDEDAWQ